MKAPGGASVRPVLLTGGTGFLGGFLARELHEAGYALHVLARETSPRAALADLPIVWHTADLRDSMGLSRVVRAVAEVADQPPWLVHNAALISYRRRDRGLQQQINAEATRHLLTIAQETGFERALHVGSMAAVGVARADETLDEDSPFESQRLGVAYVETKRAAEEHALAAAERGFDVRIVDPGAIFGPVGLSCNTSRFIVGIAAGRVGRWAPPGGMSVVGVRDTARGARQALERGQPGRRYLLVESYWSYRDLFALVGTRLFGRDPVRGTLPRSFWPLVVQAARFVDRLRPLELTPPEALVMLGQPMRFSGQRARDELGWRPQPFEIVLDEVLAHLAASGLLTARPPSAASQ